VKTCQKYTYGIALPKGPTSSKLSSIIKSRKNKKLPGEIQKYEAQFSGCHNHMP